VLFRSLPRYALKKVMKGVILDPIEVRLSF
jgi:hypothetical protein